MKKILLSILFTIIIVATAVTTFAVFYRLFNPSRELDDNSKRLCMEYALRNHEKEVSPERWEWLQKFGNPNDVDFFYQSCLNHISCSITGDSGSDCKLPNKEYMK